MKRCIPHFAITMTLLSFAFGQSATNQASQTNESEQEVRQAIEKYEQPCCSGTFLHWKKSGPMTMCL
jgi:hypothetical protein